MLGKKPKGGGTAVWMSFAGVGQSKPHFDVRDAVHTFSPAEGDKSGGELGAVELGVEEGGVSEPVAEEPSPDELAAAAAAAERGCRS